MTKLCTSKKQIHKLFCSFFLLVKFLFSSQGTELKINITFTLLISEQKCNIIILSLIKSRFILAS